MTPLRALVFAEPRAPSPGRTLRGLRSLGLDPLDLTAAPRDARAQALERGPAWLLRAGVWPVALEPFAAPPPSSTGQPLCALGRAVSPFNGRARGARAAAWEEALALSGGDFDAHIEGGGALPPIESAYLEAPVARALATCLREGQAWSSALAAAVRAVRARVVRVPTLDVYDDPGLRVAQVVTSAQQGGAERLALDLAQSLIEQGVTPRLVLLGRPSRKAFVVPEGTVDLSRSPGSHADRLHLLCNGLARWGADLVHAHLVSLSDLRALARGGYPALVTVHNMRPGWPPDLAAIGAGDAVLLVGCARAVEEELRAAAPPVALRTVWNGIHLPASARPAPGPADARATTRHELGIGADDVVLLAMANPRPQKRLHLLPEILVATIAALRQRNDHRAVHLLLAGDLAPRSEGGQQALADVLAATTRCGDGGRVRMLGSIDPVGPLLAAADVVVSPSAYEGLSLVHLEALAAGRAVIASGAGGTEELSRTTTALTFLPESAAPATFATAIVAALERPPRDGSEAVARHFTSARMAQGYARLYPRAAARAAGSRGEGIVLVTNNFSTGGAQSSARRLLLGLAEQGVRARAVVLEEQPEHPTPGRKSLLDAGIPVLALPSGVRREPGAAARAIIGWISEDPPESVLFWNAIAEHKLLLADALFDLHLFDVSPGEMYFSSLARYFTSPRAGLPCLSPRDYGARLAGAVVKYEAERALCARTLGAPVHVIANGVPLLAPREVRDRAPLVIGTTVRIHPHKKLEDLLAAFRLTVARVPGAVLHVAGDPDRGQEAYAETLRRASADLPVKWLGETASSEAFLQTLDVFALVAEPAGCPNASLEAMAASLPIAATDVGGMSEQIEDGVSGRLVPRDDPRALATALVELCNDISVRRRFGRAAWERARAQFSVTRMIADYRRVCLAEPVTPEERSSLRRSNNP